MNGLSRFLLTAGFLLVVLVPMNQVRADDCGGTSCLSCNSCGGCASCGVKAWLAGLCAHVEPDLTYYAPYPYWLPNYFGPPGTPYQQVQYWTPPAESARIVKERIQAINAANPAMIPPGKEPLPFPKPDKKEPPTKLP